MPFDFDNSANEYTDTVAFTSTGADVRFGFDARRVRLRNDAAKSIYFTIRSYTGATTSGHELKSSEEITIADVTFSGLSFVATSSGSLRIGAWG